jgi:hypothetical protein
MGWEFWLKSRNGKQATADSYAHTCTVQKHSRRVESTSNGGTIDEKELEDAHFIQNLAQFRRERRESERFL